MRFRVTAKSMFGRLPEAIRTSSGSRLPNRAHCSKTLDTPLPEWRVERGIGETRAALVENGEIVEARSELNDMVRAGSVIKARLVNLGLDGRNAIAVGEGGAEYMLPRGAPGVTQGATLAIEITRETIPGAEPWKLPLARMTDRASAPAERSKDWIGAREIVFPTPRDELGEVGGHDLIGQSRTGVVAFPGAELRISPHPAITLITLDCS